MFAISHHMCHRSAHSEKEFHDGLGCLLDPVFYGIISGFVWKLSKFEERMWKSYRFQVNFIYWLLKPNLL